MNKIGIQAKIVIEKLEKKFSLEQIVKTALEDKDYSSLLETTIKYGGCR